MKPDQTAPKICLLKILLLPAENEAENGAYWYCLHFFFITKK